MARMGGKGWPSNTNIRKHHHIQNLICLGFGGSANDRRFVSAKSR